MSIEVLNESDLPVEEARLQRLARFVMDRMRVHPQAELCLTCVDETTIAELNARWMDKQGPTDVLAFPMDELRPGMVGSEPEEGVLGDLVVCPAVAAQQASAAGHATEVELDLLVTHGILHLLGYDHAEAGEKQEMFALQSELLTAWLRDLAERTGGAVDEVRAPSPTEA